MTKILNKYGKNNVQQGQKTKKGNKKFNNFKTYFLIFILIVITKKKTGNPIQHWRISS